MKLQDKILYWIKCFSVLIAWFAISTVGFLSGAVIIAHILKHQFGVKGLWLQNDTVDGDFPPEWWVEKYGTGFKYLDAILWWFRNHSWNFIEMFKQPSTANREDVTVHKQYIKLEGDHHYLSWADTDDGIIGYNYVEYTAQGKKCIRASFANSWITLQIGSGGDRYKCLVNPIWPLLVIIGAVIILLRII